MKELRSPVKVYVEHGAMTTFLKQLRQRGLIDIVHFPYDPNSWRKGKVVTATPSAARFCDLNASWNELGSIKWSDLQSSVMYATIIAVIGAENRRDALHVDSALKSGCVCFITADTDIIGHREELEQLTRMKFFAPHDEVQLSQFLASIAR